MIVGLGSDLVSIERIAFALKNKKFLHRVFTSYEQEKAQKRACVAASLAKRFAAKEAFIKAFPGSWRYAWRDMEVQNTREGQPYFVLYHQLKNDFEEKVQGHIHLSLSDEKKYAYAVVVIEKKNI